MHYKYILFSGRKVSLKGAKISNLVGVTSTPWTNDPSLSESEGPLSSGWTSCRWSVPSTVRSRPLPTCPQTRGLRGHSFSGRARQGQGPTARRHRTGVVRTGGRQERRLAVPLRHSAGAPNLCGHPATSGNEQIKYHGHRTNKSTNLLSHGHLSRGQDQQEYASLVPRTPESGEQTTPRATDGKGKNKRCVKCVIIKITKTQIVLLKIVEFKNFNFCHMYIYKDSNTRFSFTNKTFFNR